MVEVVKKATAATRQGVWRYFGAMMMEEKTTSDGRTMQAVSFTRTLGVVMFIFAMVKWSMNAEMVDQAFFTLCGLLGLKGAKDVAAQFKKAA